MKSGMALKKLEFTPESGNVDTYDLMIQLEYRELLSLLCTVDSNVALSKRLKYVSLFSSRRDTVSIKNF